MSDLLARCRPIATHFNYLPQDENDLKKKNKIKIKCISILSCSGTMEKHPSRALKNERNE